MRANFPLESLLPHTYRLVRIAFLIIRGMHSFRVLCVCMLTKERLERETTARTGIATETMGGGYSLPLVLNGPVPVLRCIIASQPKTGKQS